MTEDVKTEVVQQPTFEESIEFTLTQLQRVKQGMHSSNRQLYQAVGEFVESAQHISEAARDLLDDVSMQTPSESWLSQKLQAQWEKWRKEADDLLCSAEADQDIDRVLKLEQLIDRLQLRLQQLSSPAFTSEVSSCPSRDLEKLSVTELKDIAKRKGLKGYSKLKRSQLIDLIQSHL